MKHVPQRALVTGGTGFLGRHVLAAATELEIWSLGRHRPQRVTAGRHIQLESSISESFVREAVKIVRPDIVIHLAGIATGRDLSTMYNVNAVFAAHLLTALASEQPRARVFLAGSAAEYGPVSERELPVTEATPAAPREPYGISKLAQTLHGLSAAEHGLGVVIGRLFNVVGLGMREHLALGSFAAQIARMGPDGGQLVTGDLGVERDFIHANDTARLILALVRRPDATGVVNICSGVPSSLKLLVDELVRRCGLPITIWQDPNRRGTTSVRRHFGSPTRLRQLGFPVPSFNPIRAAADFVGAVSGLHDGIPQ